MRFRSDKLTQTGVMFDTLEDDPFPRLVDLARTHRYGLPLGDPPAEIADWYAIASDPRAVRYFDDDSEAMDTTNWDAIVSSMTAVFGDELPRIFDRYTRDGWVLDGLDDDAIADGAMLFGRVLLIAPDWYEGLAEAQELSSALANYPLLDEDAYSQLEYDAWQDYAPQAFRDELRYEHRDIDEDTADALIDATDDILGDVAQYLHHYQGFTGEYGPDFVAIIAEHVARLAFPAAS